MPERRGIEAGGGAEDYAWQTLPDRMRSASRRSNSAKSLIVVAPRAFFDAARRSMLSRASEPCLRPGRGAAVIIAVGPPRGQTRPPTPFTPAGKAHAPGGRLQDPTPH